MSDVSLDELRALQDDLRALGRAEANVEAPARVRDAVLAGWDAAHPAVGRHAANVAPAAPTTAAARRVWWAVTAGLAAAAALVALVLWPRPQINPGLISARQEINPGLISQRGLMGQGQLTQAGAVVPATRAADAAVTSRPAPVARADTAQWVVIGQPIADDERISVVRVRMAATSLAALGGESRHDTSDTVDVDLLVGEDGVTRGVRMW